MSDLLTAVLSVAASVVGCALPGVLLGLLLTRWRCERRRQRARRDPPTVGQCQ